jgi:hypothetical protein
MRSSLIFSVSAKFSNRYVLCRMVAASSRKMHRDGISTSQSINRSLQALHDAAVAGQPPASPVEPGNRGSAEAEAAAVLAP